MPKPRKIELLFAAVGNQAADISVERIKPAGAFATRFAAAEAIDAPVPHGRRQVGQHRTREVDLRAPLPQHQKNVLHDILGEVAVVNQTESPDAQRLVMHQKELPELGRMSVQFLHLLKSGRYGRPQSSESIFKYTKTRPHPEVFRENNAKRPKPNGMSFRTALFRRRLLAAGVPENKSLPVRCFFGIETKVRESLPHFVSDSQTPPFYLLEYSKLPQNNRNDSNHSDRRRYRNST